MCTLTHFGGLTFCFCFSLSFWARPSSSSFLLSYTKRLSNDERSKGFFVFISPHGHSCQCRHRTTAIIHRCYFTIRLANFRQTRKTWGANHHYIACLFLCHVKKAGFWKIRGVKTESFHYSTSFCLSVVYQSFLATTRSRTRVFISLTTDKFSPLKKAIAKVWKLSKLSSSSSSTATHSEGYIFSLCNSIISSIKEEGPGRELTRNYFLFSVVCL